MRLYPRMEHRRQGLVGIAFVPLNYIAIGNDLSQSTLLWGLGILTNKRTLPQTHNTWFCFSGDFVIFDIFWPY